MHTPAYRKLVRASALYDILVTAPLATPWTLAPLHALMSRLNVQLGGAPLPAFEPFHMFIAGLLGSVVVVWSLLRLRHPSRRPACTTARRASCSQAGWRGRWRRPVRRCCGYCCCRSLPGG